MGRTTGRDTQAQESVIQRGGMGMGMGGNEYGSGGIGGVGNEYSSGDRGRDMGREGGLGRTGENEGVDDEFMSSRDPMIGKQRDVGDTYGHRSARDEEQRTTGAMGGPPGTAGLTSSQSEQEAMGGGRQRHHGSDIAGGGVSGRDIGDDPMMSGRDQASKSDSGLGGVSGMDSGKRDTDSYGGSYAGSGHPRSKRDSITGRFMEKAGGILGNAKMEEKGHERREARQRGE